jgi:hypothetical protein
MKIMLSVLLSTLSVRIARNVLRQQRRNRRFVRL